MKPVSSFELSVQDRLIWLEDAATAVRLVGDAGKVGVGGGVVSVLLIWTIFATEGTPFEFRMNSM